MSAFPGTHTRESKHPRGCAQQYPGNLRSTDPTWVRVAGLLNPHINRSPRPSVLLCRSPESSRNLHLQTFEGKGISIFKSVVLKSCTETPETSQPSGLLLPFPVPSKVSWRHKQAGGTSLASSPQPPCTPYWLRLRHAPPGAHTRAHTPRARTPIQPTDPAPGHPLPQHDPSRRTPRSGSYIKHSPQNRLPCAPASG